MKYQRLCIIILALAVLTTLGVGMVRAQEPGSPEGVTDETASVANVIPIQGRLTNASGVPLNGTYGIQASIYDASEAFLCGDWQNVPVTNGLFTMNVGTGFAVPCQSSQINGDELYLGIKVGPLGGPEPEMTPRQYLPCTLCLDRKAGSDHQGCQLADLCAGQLVCQEQQHGHHALGYAGQRRSSGVEGRDGRGQVYLYPYHPTWCTVWTSGDREEHHSLLQVPKRRKQLYLRHLDEQTDVC
jgi:hypothetical protein